MIFIQENAFQNMVCQMAVTCPGPRSTNDILIEFKIRPKFEVLWFKKYSADYNKILNTSWQDNCCDLSKILLQLFEIILNYSTPNFDRIRIRSKSR